MSFHKSNFGSFGEGLPCDLNGFVPEDGDDAASFDFGDDRFTADFDKHGNGYEGYAEESWREFVADAVEKTANAAVELEMWRQ